MDQRSAVVGLLLFVLAAFGGLTFYDVKYGHKVEKLLGREPKAAQNWRWEDRWDGKGDPAPRPVTPPPVDVPAQQLIAGNYREAVQKSGEVGKPVLVFFTADWCAPCKKMKAETMADRQVQAMLKSYILVYVDTDNDRAPATKFGVEGLPSYVVTNAKEEKLKFDAGFKAADSFAAWLNNPSLYVQPKNQIQVQPPTPKTPTPPEDHKRPFRKNQPPRPNTPNMQPGPNGPNGPNGPPDMQPGPGG